MQTGAGMMSEEEEFAAAFLEDYVTLHKQRRVPDSSGGSTMTPWKIEGIRASVRPGSASESEEGGRLVRIQTGEVRLPASVSVAQGDEIEHASVRWKVLGDDDQLSGKMLTIVNVQRIVP